jgi:uncharacterized RDD family membrane protein YckC
VMPYVPVAPDGRPLAHASARFLAKLLDGLILLAAVVLCAAAFIGFSLLFQEHAFVIAAILRVVGILFALFGLPYLYNVEYALRHDGRTIGKRAMRIAVVPLEPGAGLTRRTLAARWGIELVFNILSACYVGYVDSLWLLWDKPYRQCLHDKAARTTVIALA